MTKQPGRTCRKATGEGLRRKRGGKTVGRGRVRFIAHGNGNGFPCAVKLAGAATFSLKCIMIKFLRGAAEHGHGKVERGHRKKVGGATLLPIQNAHQYANTGNADNLSAQATSRRFWGVFGQIDLRKQRHKPPKTAAKPPSDCLR